ncbi:MAG TPA: metalloregulator ArsR/SmtB family transcription factor [Actinophytocola sp.]|uniref:helix-turn-helix domain-containing GNAT family N-acetyltransferase n=1 Tax=Actinophytocola sp. TaxID=1872138 RepID=UPI002E04B7B0|nr:metalloregulator ArsR/SmtB family transcription factor [Actinophytocola sp.]
MESMLDHDAAAIYASWFACLADPTRVRVLHAVASANRELPVGELAERVGISQPTCSHHVKKLAEVGFVLLRKAGTATMVTVNDACCVGLPHAADVVMGALAARPCCPEDLPAGVSVRALARRDWPAVRHIYAEGIATRNATFETRVPTRETLDRKWLPGHRWVAEVAGEIAGWAAISPVSARACYAGVGENSLYVGERFRGRGVGKALIHRQVTAADAGGLWTLQSAIFPENKASLTLHRSAGFRTVGIRERIAQLDGIWRDTVFIERRADRTTADPCGC